MDGGSPALSATPVPELPKPRLRICIQNDDGKGVQHALAMPPLRDAGGKGENNRLTVQDGWVDAHLKRAHDGRIWIIVTDLELGLQVGGWRVQTLERYRTYVEVFDTGLDEWRDVTEKEFKEWERLNA